MILFRVYESALIKIADIEVSLYTYYFIHSSTLCFVELMNLVKKRLIRSRKVYSEAAIRLILSYCLQAE